MTFSTVGGEIVKFRSEEGVRPLAFVDRMATTILHAEQFVLALVELVIADGGDIQSHHRQRFDGGLIVEHRRQEGTGADQIARRNEDCVVVAVAKFLDQRCHVLGATGGDEDFFGLVVGIGDPDPAGRRAKVAVKIVDRENAQLHRRATLRVSG